MRDNPLSIYALYDFKFILLKDDKSPATRGDWRLEENQITLEKALQYQSLGHKIGALIPKDVVILDLDRHEGKPDGMKTMQAISKQYGIEINFINQTFTVKTGGGGIHVVLTTDKTWRQNSKAPGIDLKTSKGYVVAAGSPGYEVLNDSEPMPMPLEIEFWLEGCEFDRTENTAESQTEILPESEIREIRSALAFLPSDDRDEWVRAGLELKSTGSPAAYGLWNEWSQKSEKYNAADMEKRWWGFKPKDITIASLFYRAKQVGWVTTYEWKDEVPSVAQVHGLKLPEIDFNPFSFEKILNLDIPEPEWLWDEIIPQVGVGQLFSPPKGFKSYCVLNLMRAFTCGELFLNRHTKKIQSLYLSGEDNVQRLQSRLKLLKFNYIENPAPFHLLSNKDIETVKFNNESYLDFIKRIIRKSQAQFVVIDPLRILFRDNIEIQLNDYNNVYSLIEPIKNLAEELNIFIMIIHHSRKKPPKSTTDSRDMEQALGSQALLGAFDLNINLTKDGNGFLEIYAEGKDTYMDEPILAKFDNGFFKLRNDITSGYVNAVKEVMLEKNLPPKGMF